MNHQIKDINDLLPFLDYDDNIMLGRNGELTCGFHIRFPPIFTKDANHFNELFKIISVSLSALPDYTRIHKQDIFTLQNVKLDAATYLEEQRMKMFASQKILKQESFLYITMVPSIIHEASLLQYSAFNKIRSYYPGESKIKQFKENVHAFCSLFESVMKKEKEENTFSMKPLTPEDFLGINGTLAKYIYLTEECCYDIIINKNTTELRIGDNLVDIVSLSDLEDLPLTLSPTKYYRPYSTEDTRLHLSMMAKCGAFLQFPHIINTIVIKGNTDREKKKLETKGTVLQNFGTTSRENRLAGEDIDIFLEEQASQGGEITDCHVNIMAWANDQQTLLKRRSEVINALKGLNLTPKTETLNKANTFFACIPGNTANIFKEMRFKTMGHVAASFFNLDDLQQTINSKAPLQVVDRFTGAPLNIDISDYAMERGWVENLNKFVLGSSGGGKSVAINYYTMSNLRAGAHVVTIDMGKSSEGVCHAFGGLWFEYTNEHPISFNPFILHDFDWVGGKLSLLKTTTLIGIIKLLWRGANGIFTESESTTLEKMVDSYYQSEPIEYSFDAFYEFVTNEQKFQINPTIQFHLNDFKYVLEQYYRDGKYGHLLNAPNGLSLLEHQLIVFELKGIQESKLFPIIAFVIMDTIVTKLNYLPTVRKQVVLDEAWKSLATPQLETFFQELVKTIRKLNGEIIFISQEIEDLISSSIIKNSIINNCATKILLSQNQYQKRFDAIQSVLGLTDHEKDLTFSLNKNKTDNSKDILVLYSNGPGAVYSIKLSLAEYLVCTSKQEEKDGIRKVAKYLNSTYFEAIQFIVENLADKISDIMKTAEKKGEKILYNTAVDKILENYK